MKASGENDVLGMNCLVDPHRDMDAVFYDIASGSSLVPVMKDHGPYRAVWLAGGSGIIFGKEQVSEDPAAAYTAGAMGGIAVRAASGERDSATTLRHMAEMGATGVALHSKAMHDALLRVELGQGQVAALAIAANCTDQRAYPPLRQTLLSAAALSNFAVPRADRKMENSISFYDSEAVLQAVHKAILGYANKKFGLKDNPDQVLAHVYSDLITRAKEASPQTAEVTRRAWLRGLYGACEALKAKGVDLNKILLPGVLEHYKEAGTTDLPQWSSSFSIGTIDPSRLPTHSTSSRRRPAKAARPETGTTPLQRTREWHETVTQHLTAFAQCLDRGQGVADAITELKRDRPYMSEVRQREAKNANQGFWKLLRQPNILGSLLPHQGKTLAEDGAVVAAAQAHHAPPEAVRSRADRARQYLLQNYKALNARSIRDLSDEDLAEMGIGRDDVNRYFDVRPGPKAPEFLIQLATQVVVDNARSVLARGPRPRLPSESADQWLSNLPLTKMRYITQPPGSNPSGAAEKVRKEYARRQQAEIDLRRWHETGRHIDDVADELRTFLEARYRTSIPDPTAFGEVLGSPDAHLKFRALAMCAQGEAEDILNAPAEMQTLFAQRAAAIFSRVRPELIPHYFPAGTAASNIYKLYRSLTESAQQTKRPAEPLPGLGRLAGLLRGPNRTQR